MPGGQRSCERNVGEADGPSEAKMIAEREARTESRAEPSVAPADELPLSGVRVLALGDFRSGPYPAAILAEFGAEVIKLRDPFWGQPLRAVMGHPCHRASEGDADQWLKLAGGSRTVTLDLRDADGGALFRRLVTTADVLIESSRPGAMEAWGLGWTALSSLNPGLVMLRAASAPRPGTAARQIGLTARVPVFAASCGVCAPADDTSGGAAGGSQSDYLSSLYGAIEVMAALKHKEKTGRGQLIEVGPATGVDPQSDGWAPRTSGDAAIDREEKASGLIPSIVDLFRARPVHIVRDRAAAEPGQGAARNQRMACLRRNLGQRADEVIRDLRRLRGHRVFCPSVSDDT